MAIMPAQEAISQNGTPDTARECFHAAAREYLHTTMIRAWFERHRGAPPSADLGLIRQAIYEVCRNPSGDYVVDDLADAWLTKARECGLAVDEDDTLRPDVLDAISTTVSDAIWWALTEGYPAITGDSISIPRRHLPLGAGDA